MEDRRERAGDLHRHPGGQQQRACFAPTGASHTIQPSASEQHDSDPRLSARAALTVDSTLEGGDAAGTNRSR